MAGRSDTLDARTDQGRKRGRDSNTDGGASSSACRSCAESSEARAFLRSLELNEAMLDANFDRCYCANCFGTSPETVQAAGQTYEIPLGFSGFGIKCPPRAHSLAIFEKWPVSYHGLRAANVKSVLNEGGLLLPGDQLLDGSVLSAIHTRGGADRQRLYTSPSVRYSERCVYTSPVRFGSSMVKLVLQCRQMPEFEVCGETIGWERQHPGVSISPHFPNSSLERFTLRRNSIIPYRLLIKFERDQISVWWQLPPAAGGESEGGGANHQPRGFNARTRENQIVKCNPFEFLIPGDVVRAKAAINWPSKSVSKDAMGVVQTVDGRADPQKTQVDWSAVRASPRSDVGVMPTQKGTITKCAPTEFLKKGDIVKATIELDYGEKGIVPKDSLGTVMDSFICPCSTLAFGTRTDCQVQIDWGRNRSFGITSEALLGHASSHQVRKADPIEFWSAGDVVRATKDVDYSGESGLIDRIVRAGSIGTLATTVGDIVSVDWSPHSIGKANVARDAIIKCDPAQHLKLKDIVRATCELKYETHTIRQGQLGTLMNFMVFDNDAYRAR